MVQIAIKIEKKRNRNFTIPIPSGYLGRE